MIRGLISLLLLASVNAAPFSPEVNPVDFNPVAALDVRPFPTKTADYTEPVIHAKAALVMDAYSGMVLYEKAVNERLAMASLAKIMTAILILESHDLNEVVTIGENYAGVPGVKIGLLKNEHITVGDLLIGLLVRSGGDAALALASFHNQDVGIFVDEMNRKAQALNLKNTHFTNPIGLDEDNNFSSAYDLALLSKYAMRNPKFRNIVRLPEAEIFSVDRLISHFFKNTNQLLGSYLNVLGVKTGTTDAAGESIINLARNAQGHEVIAIVLSSPNRFQENEALIKWAFRNHNW